MNEPIVTVMGNLTADPELRFTPAGAAVANFTVATTPRYFDKKSEEWVDGETLFMRCAIWHDQAENVAESLSKGNRVMVWGRLVQRGWEDREGNKRVSVEMQVDEIGSSLRFATVDVHAPVKASAEPEPEPEPKPRATRAKSSRARR